MSHGVYASLWQGCKRRLWFLFGTHIGMTKFVSNSISRKEELSLIATFIYPFTFLHKGKALRINRYDFACTDLWFCVLFCFPDFNSTKSNEASHIFNILYSLKIFAVS